MSFFRYPGGKRKLRALLVDRLTTMVPEGLTVEYREPFFGGGGIGLKFLASSVDVDSLWLNDKDKGIACLWTSVMNYPDELCKLIELFIPTVARFYDFKELLLNPYTPCASRDDILELGFKKLAIHQMSYSGLGTKSGGPLGGRSQQSKYPIDCRWSPKYMVKKIRNLHKQLSNYNIRRNECTSLDFMDVIEDNTKPTVMYLDPPYFLKGNELYQEGFTEQDHVRLSYALKNSPHFWVLSYDDCPEIRDLYAWAYVEVTNVNYTITATKDGVTGERKSRNKPELVIYPREFESL